MGTIDVSGLTSGYTDYMNVQSDNYKTEALKNTVSGDYSQASDEKLMDACKQFESYFLEQVLKEMEKTIPKNEDSSESSSNMVDYFKDTTMQELAKESTDSNSLGLAQTLYEQMKRNYSV